MIRLKQGAPLGLSWYTKYASWSPNLRYRMRIATYILIYLPIYSCLLVEYSTEKCLFLGVSKYEKGVGYVYSKSKGRGHDNFFLGNPPVFSFATVRKYPESAPAHEASASVCEGWYLPNAGTKGIGSGAVHRYLRHKQVVPAPTIFRLQLFSVKK